MSQGSAGMRGARPTGDAVVGGVFGVISNCVPSPCGARAGLCCSREASSGPPPVDGRPSGSCAAAAGVRSGASVCVPVPSARGSVVDDTDDGPPSVRAPTPVPRTSAGTGAGFGSSAGAARPPPPQRVPLPPPGAFSSGPVPVPGPSGLGSSGSGPVSVPGPSGLGSSGPLPSSMAVAPSAPVSGPGVSSTSPSPSPSPSPLPFRPAAAAAAAAVPAPPAPAPAAPVGVLSASSSALLLRARALGRDDDALELASGAGLLPLGDPVADSVSSGGAPSRSEGGYESSDDVENVGERCCVNCTAPVWGETCPDCGHVVDADSLIFAPYVSPAAVSRTRRFARGADVALAYDERFLLHCDAEDGGAHPERPDRVRAVWAMLEAADVTSCCRRLPVRPATDAEIVACHRPELVARVEAMSARLAHARGAPPALSFSSDMYLNAHTAECARLAAGACVDVALAVALGRSLAGVAIVRPPGHHAESNTGMGFCYYNNAAIAARAAQASGRARKVLIVDWDVHHGNGTQHIFEDDPSVLYVSLHRYDNGTFYPGTGAVSEVGAGAGVGTTVNVAWPHGDMGSGDYLAAFNHLILPIAREFAPDLVLVSAGFDAVAGDPIGGCVVAPECYAHLTAMLMPLGPTAVLLEGGYNLLGTAQSSLACVRAVLGERPPPLDPASTVPTQAGAATVAHAMRVHARHWHCLRGMLDKIAPPHLLHHNATGIGAGGGGGMGAGMGGQHLQEEWDEASIAGGRRDDSVAKGKDNANAQTNDARGEEEEVQGAASGGRKEQGTVPGDGRKRECVVPGNNGKGEGTFSGDGGKGECTASAAVDSSCPLRDDADYESPVSAREGARGERPDAGAASCEAEAEAETETEAEAARGGAVSALSARPQGAADLAPAAFAAVPAGRVAAGGDVGALPQVPPGAPLGGGALGSGPAPARPATGAACGRPAPAGAELTTPSTSSEPARAALGAARGGPAAALGLAGSAAGLFSPTPAGLVGSAAGALPAPPGPAAASSLQVPCARLQGSAVSAGSWAPVAPLPALPLALPAAAAAVPTATAAPERRPRPPPPANANAAAVAPAAGPAPEPPLRETPPTGPARAGAAACEPAATAPPARALPAPPARGSPPEPHQAAARRAWERAMGVKPPIAKHAAIHTVAIDPQELANVGLGNTAPAA